jgi:predicted TPR repeat methyltransferase
VESERLRQAQSAHRAGHFSEAERGYREILKTKSQDPDALHFLGLLSFQRDRHAEGIQHTRHSLQVAPDNPHAWNNLGNMLVACDEPQAAVEAYQRATSIAPEMVQAWYNLGICFRRTKQIPESIAAFYKAVELQPADTAVYERFGMLLYGIGRFQEAANIYRQWLAREPTSAAARHMLAAMTGDDVPARADDQYLRELFDGFSDSFDEQLAKLGYRAPELLVSALGEFVSTDGRMDILDAGCGTGLCGSLLRSTARRLVGVDLSEGMVKKARERQVYDELVVGELCEFMRSRPVSFEVVISADTLVYFGALEEVSQAARECLRQGGVLTFTLERLERPIESAGFSIQPHGRYAHTESYVRSTLKAAGFAVVHCHEVILRKERHQDVGGYLFVAIS